jgi:hypothetical protein
MRVVVDAFSCKEPGRVFAMADVGPFSVGFIHMSVILPIHANGRKTRGVYKEPTWVVK